MAVTLTEAAARHVTRYLGRRGKGVGVRLGVKTTGCSGLAYKLEYADEIAPEDLIFTEAVFSGPAADPAAIHAEMDAVEHHRETAQPIREKTGGSTFKNPPGHSSWKLVDEAGWRIALPAFLGLACLGEGAVAVDQAIGVEAGIVPVDRRQCRLGHLDRG